MNLSNLVSTELQCVYNTSDREGQDEKTRAETCEGSNVTKTLLPVLQIVLLQIVTSSRMNNFLDISKRLDEPR